MSGKILRGESASTEIGAEDWADNASGTLGFRKSKSLQTEAYSRSPGFEDTAQWPTIGGVGRAGEGGGGNIRNRQAEEMTKTIAEKLPSFSANVTETMPAAVVPARSIGKGAWGKDMPLADMVSTSAEKLASYSVCVTENVPAVAPSEPAVGPTAPAAPAAARSSDKGAWARVAAADVATGGAATASVTLTSSGKGAWNKGAWGKDMPLADKVSTSAEKLASSRVEGTAAVSSGKGISGKWASTNKDAVGSHR